MVVGAGGSGLVTAARASVTDHDVLVVKGAERVGGKTRLSTTQICGVDTRFQDAAGIDDSPDDLVADLLADDDYDVADSIDPNHVRTVAARSAETLHWFADYLDVDFHLHTGPYTQSQHGVPRTHYPRDRDGEIPRHGEPLVEPLVAEARDNGATIRTGTPIDQLVVYDGTVVGAVSKADPQPDPRRAVAEWIRADAVVLASDGYNANHEMRLADFPETAGLKHWGIQGNTGDSVR